VDEVGDAVAVAAADGDVPALGAVDAAAVAEGGGVRLVGLVLQAASPARRSSTIAVRIMLRWPLAMSIFISPM
jgi:hypothetical protein